MQHARELPVYPRSGLHGASIGIAVDRHGPLSLISCLRRAAFHVWIAPCRPPALPHIDACIRWAINIPWQVVRTVVPA